MKKLLQFRKTSAAALLLLLCAVTAMSAQNMVNVPAGTRLVVRMVDGISGGNSRAGTLFTARLQGNLMVGNTNVAPDGSMVFGRIIASSGASRVAGRSELSLELTDIQVNGKGSGSATVAGVFDVETFSVSPGGTTTFAPTHQYHLGAWFDDPKVPFNLGCEPGATSPIVTPFNGKQHAGIQVVNTAQFPADAGPLSNVHR